MHAHGLGWMGELDRSRALRERTPGIIFFRGGSALEVGRGAGGVAAAVEDSADQTYRNLVSDPRGPKP